MSPWIYLRLLILPTLVITSGYLGGWWTFSVPVFSLVVHPLAVIILNQRANDDHHDHNKYPALVYRMVALVFVPVLLAVTTWAVINSPGFSPVERAGLCLSVGIVNAILGFTLAHEFVHSRWLPEKIAGQLLLAQNNYPHYGIEHIAGHHVYACTPKDPHTAQLGESIYRFLVRTLPQTLRNAWEIERVRLQRRKHPVISRHNRMIKMITLQLSVNAVIIVAFGWLAFAFFIVQSFIAIIILNITEYLQHYGLLRKEIADGRFEKVTAIHAWASARNEDGLSLFKLDNHADHHIHPSHPYEQLVHLHESPEQPTGYSGMMWLALVPPLWFRVMNKRIISYHLKTSMHEDPSNM
jgi:alkane 1-monooxygenase